MLHELLIIITASLFIALTAQIRIPLWPVPVTGQTFGILLVAGILGKWRGIMAVIAYLCEGALGLPVFAGGGSVLSFIGPTGGYLLGFIFAAFVVGWLSEQNKNNQFSKTSQSHHAGSQCSDLTFETVFGQQLSSVYDGPQAQFQPARPNTNQNQRG